MHERDLGYYLFGSWGDRPVRVDHVTECLRETFHVLDSWGGPLAGPWLRDFKDAIDVTSVPDLRDHLVASPLLDDRGDLIPDYYSVRFYVGRWDGILADRHDRGTLSILLSGRSVNKVALQLEGASLAIPARENAQSLVCELARIWRVDFIAFSDSSLGALNSERARRRGRRGSYPAWGYEAWVSDTVSRGLERVDGARTQRYGTGTLISTDSWVPEEAAEVWRNLLDTKRLRAADNPQENPPTFDGEAGSRL